VAKAGVDAFAKMLANSAKGAHWKLSSALVK